MGKSYTKPNGKSSTGKPQFKPDPKKYLYNIDTFWFNVGAENYQEVMDAGLRDSLIAGREYSSDYDDHMIMEVPLEGYENPLEFRIDAGQKPLYQYSLRNDDIAIYFAKNERSEQLPMKVQINQFILWDKGVKAAFEESKRVLKAFGFDITVCRLNRVDFAVHSDQFQWIQSDFKTFVYPRNIAMDNFPDFISNDPCTGKFETVYFGSRKSKTLLLRIYNKSIEAKKKKKNYFFDLYKEKGMNPDKVWNVEFEVHRKFIKECKGLDDARLFDDLEVVFEEDRLSLLWTYLLKMYSHDSAHWTQLKKGDSRKFTQNNGYLTRRKDNVANAYRETAQIRGRLMTYVMNDEKYTMDNALAKFLEMNQKYEEATSKSWEKEVVRKKARFHDEEINSTIGRVDKALEKDKKIREEHRKEVEKLLKEKEEKRLKEEIEKKQKDEELDKEKEKTLPKTETPNWSQLTLL